MAYHKPLRIAGIVQDSIVDGPGLRYVIFVQGCPHDCKGCHNPETHDFAGGKIAVTREILDQILQNKRISGVTFSGGEPFCQPEALAGIARVLKEHNKHLMIYTGFLYEKLLEMQDENVQKLLELTDILVDGPFVLEQRNLTLPYRGSENQRVIDLQKTRQQGEIVLYRSEYEDLL